MTSTPLYDIYQNSISENFTEDAAAICRRIEPLRILSICFSFAAAVFLIHLVTALCIHSYKKKLIIGCRGTQIASGDQAVSVVNFVTVCGAVFVFVYVIIEIPLLVPPTHNFCNFYYWIETICYGGAVLCAYFALWYRIHSVFYRNSIMKQSISKWLQVLNYMTIIFGFLMAGTILSIFLSAPASINMPCGCEPVYSKKIVVVKWVVLVVCTTAFQFTLLITFIYPLQLHRKKMINRPTNQRSIIHIVRRSSVVAGICVLSDLVNFGFAVAYRGETLYIPHVVYSCNLIVNLMGVVFTFSNWREKLLPCRKSNDQIGTSSKITDCSSVGSSNTKATNIV